MSYTQSLKRRAVIKTIAVGSVGVSVTTQNSEEDESPPGSVNPPLAHEQSWSVNRPTFSDSAVHQQSWAPVRPQFTAVTHQQTWEPIRPVFNSQPVHTELWSESEGPPTNPLTGNQPTDPDGDGLYEDVNGNGELDIGDVQALFALLVDSNNSYLEENKDLFDFNGDGKVDLGDVRALFTEIFG